LIFQSGVVEFTGLMRIVRAEEGSQVTKSLRRTRPLHICREFNVNQPTCLSLLCHFLPKALKWLGFSARRGLI